MLVRLHLLLDGCTKSRDNISESEVDLHCKTDYQNYICSFKRGKKIRNYCVCTPGVWLCSDFNFQLILIQNI